MPSTLRKQALEANLGYYEGNSDAYVRNIATMDISPLQNSFMSQLSESAHILDAGCGSGRDSAVFLSKGHRVTAIDASPAMVRIARKNSVVAKVMTFDQINYRSEFEAIWACASLLHVPKEEIASILKRLYRALKPGGILFVSLKEGRGQRVIDDGRFFAYYELKEFSEMLRECGAWATIETARDSGNGARAWLNFVARRESKKNLRMNKAAESPLMASQNKRPLTA